MSYSRCNTRVVAVVLTVVLSACRNETLDNMQAAQAAMSDQVAQLESRVEALETRPRLDFTLTDTQISFNEKTFTPILVATSQLSVQGDKMPPTFYVDVMLKIAVPDIQYEAVERQIFPVVEGKGKLQMQQRLPQHGLKPEQIQVTLKPMTWYRGQIISDDMVNYQ